MSESRFYYTDPGDPWPPVVLDEWAGLHPGDRVVYVGPMPLPGVFTIIDLVDFRDDDVVANLQDVDDGSYYQCSAVNLAPEVKP